MYNRPVARNFSQGGLCPTYPTRLTNIPLYEGCLDKLRALFGSNTLA